MAGLGVITAFAVIWKASSDRARGHMWKKLDEERKGKEEAKRWEKYTKQRRG